MLENVPCFSGWKVVRRIGRGQFGAVYEIQKESDNARGTITEHSAMEVISVPSDEELDNLRAEYGDDETIAMLLRGNLDNLVKEFKRLSRLQGHSNIVSYLDHEIVQRDQRLGWDILTRMELLTPLSDYSGGEAMEEGEILRLGMDIGRALMQCEKCGILHRNIKPQNIFVNRYGDFKLGDFKQGVWRASSIPVHISRDYIAPEAFSHLLDGDYDPRADIYSLGMVLYWLLNERRGPFLPLLPETYNSKDQSVAWGRRMNGEPLPRPAHGGRELQDVVLKACAFQPKERYQSAEEFYNALKALGRPAAEGSMGYTETNSASAVELPFIPGQPAFREESRELREDGTVFARGKESGQKSAAQNQKPADSPAFQKSGKLPETKKLLPLYIAAACAAILLAVIIGRANCWFGHTYDLETVSPQYLKSEASCTAPAVYYRSCKCGRAGTETFPYGEANGHTWDTGVVTAAATHTSAGGMRYTCAVCGQTREETTDKLITHTYDRETVSAQYLKSEATCTAPAVYYKSCECGEAGTETFTYGTLAGHSWAAATCTEPQTCRVCGVTEGSANGHDWRGATAFAPQTCQICGEQTGFATTAVAGGACGNQLKWALDNVGTLAIRGSGNMDSYEEYSTVPWYEQAKNIRSVVIEDGVTSIGGHAFFSCDNLKTVTIPNSVTLIEQSAFSGCNGLTAITIPDSVTSIGDCAFSGCGLTSVTIPDSVTSIGSYAFWSCGGLTLVKLPNSVTSLGEEAFSWCSSLTSVEIPGGITSMGNSAFSFCTNLTSVTIQEGAASIGRGAFYNCSSLASVAIPASVTSIGDNAFSVCSSLREILVDANNESFASVDGVLFSKDGSKLICYPAKHSGTSYIVPDTVTAIGAYAFQNCSDLITVAIPNSVTSIGNGAFDNCGGLTSIDLPNGVASIGDGTFFGCGSLAAVAIPNSVTSIGSSAFYNCVSLTSIPISDSVTSIGDYAFNNCSGLIAADIPSSVTSIGKYAFDNCSSLTSITIPNSVTFIGESAFGGCVGLTYVAIPDSVTSIERFTFYRCAGLTSITIPVSVVSIGWCAFDECTGLTDVDYSGTEFDRGNIAIDSSNEPLVNALWQYGG